MQNLGEEGGGVSKVHYGLCEIGKLTVKFTDVLALGTKLRLRGSDAPFVFFCVFNHVLKDFVLMSLIFYNKLLATVLAEPSVIESTFQQFTQSHLPRK